MYFLLSSLAENHEQVIGVVRYRTLYIYIYRTIELYIYIYIYIYIHVYIYIYVYVYIFFLSFQYHHSRSLVVLKFVELRAHLTVINTSR